VRTVFRNTEEHRRQWIFRNDRDIAVLVASGNAAFFGAVDEIEYLDESDYSDYGDVSYEGGVSDTPVIEAAAGFIEFRDGEGALLRERIFEQDLSQWEFRFFYEAGILLRAETWFKRSPHVPPPTIEYAYYGQYGYYNGEHIEITEHEHEEEALYAAEADEYIEIADADYIEIEEELYLGPPEFVHLTTDFFRYSRSGALRAIDRIFHADDETARVLFPRHVQVASFDREEGTLPVFYTPDFLLVAMNVQEGARITYTLDGRGRLLYEVWRDEEGRVLAELINTWEGDRLVSILWRTDYDERLVEYEHDYEGNRIAERNYRNGVLERTVSTLGDQDIEEIFIAGQIALRAVWEAGLLISEEIILQAGIGGLR
jgi:hypothetical protein